MTSALPITPARVNQIMAELRPDVPELGRVSRHGCVEGAIGNALNAAMYHLDSGDPDPLHVAVFLVRSLAQNHCFEDGNKRIAWAVLLEILWVHVGVNPQVAQDEAAKMVNQIATKQLGVNDFIRWLDKHLVPLD